MGRVGVADTGVPRLGPVAGRFTLTTVVTNVGTEGIMQETVIDIDVVEDTGVLREFEKTTIRSWLSQFNFICFFLILFLNLLYNWIV